MGCVPGSQCVVAADDLLAVDPDLDPEVHDPYSAAQLLTHIDQRFHLVPYIVVAHDEGPVSAVHSTEEVSDSIFASGLEREVPVVDHSGIGMHEFVPGVDQVAIHLVGVEVEIFLVDRTGLDTRQNFLQTEVWMFGAFPEGAALKFDDSAVT